MRASSHSGTQFVRGRSSRQLSPYCQLEIIRSCCRQSRASSKSSRVRAGRWSLSCRPLSFSSVLTREGVRNPAPVRPDPPLPAEIAPQALLGALAEGVVAQGLRREQRELAPGAEQEPSERLAGGDQDGLDVHRAVEPPLADPVGHDERAALERPGAPAPAAARI